MSELPPIEEALCVAKCRASEVAEKASAAYWMRGADTYTANYLINQVLEDFDKLSEQIDVIRAAMAGDKSEEAA